MLLKTGFTRLLSLFALGSVLLTSCGQEKKEDTKTLGSWRGEFSAQGKKIPFNFELHNHDGKYAVHLLNGDNNETIESVKVTADSLIIEMPVFDAKLEGAFKDGKIEGRLVKNYAEGYIIPFTAEHGKKFRFEARSGSSANFNGRWKVKFGHYSDDRFAVGIFKQEGSKVQGTFLTTTGDYRFLEGDVIGKTMYLSTFDGEHVYRFEGKMTEQGRIEGSYISGLKGKNTWSAIHDESVKLPDANSLTYVTDKSQKVSLELPNINGETLSFPGEKYKNKVTVLQILGSWCPNCLDETAFLSDYYKKNKDRGLEIIGLGYERRADFDYASKMLKKLQKRYDIQYDLVVAGKSGTKNVEKTFPMLNKIMSFPTTIILDRKGEIRNIHTGFSGPATGKAYEDFKKEFTEKMDELLNEQPS
ncbi:hypothetical protein FUAX_22870 [Fulvitalea axinellae]|uniref:Thioredoxin domain-containing protein n=1 Tax=Fulvitalea axinellae TaxID=1182444 RepID=A0AAU9DBT4_9BACT|nr:hypothetical protein FUAX_22870 [Fulvitalea axinellae]